VEHTLAETAAHLVDHVIPAVPVRQWVLSLPIPLRILFAAQPQLLAPLLQVIHRVIAGFLIKQAGLKRTAANTGAVTLIQRFGSAANLNIHLHCLVLDGVYRNSTGVFHEVAAPTLEELQRYRAGSGLSCALFVNHLGNFRFCPEISNYFITCAEPTYHGRVTVELTSNLYRLHVAPGTRQVRKLRSRLCPRPLSSRR
jgi:hypothetical protein